MVLEVYGSGYSHPCRLIYAVLKHLNIPYEQKSLDMRNKEHLQPHFLKLNPFHTVPTINDDGFSLFESRAIACYLIEKYSPDNQLYPNDVQKRASINRWLYWDVTSLTSVFLSYYRPFIHENAEKPDEKLASDILAKIKILDGVLGQSKYIAGDHLTLADIALAIDIAAILSTHLDLTPFHHLNKWINTLEGDLLTIWAEVIVNPNENNKKRWAEKLSASK